MAKGLPYFKFMPSEWLTGNICFEDFEIQGLFITICALYWQRDGKLSIEDINLRCRKPTALVSLTDRYFSVNDGFISIEFLDEQLLERGHVSSVNSENGKKGGRPKTKGKKPTAFNSLSETKAKKSQLELEEELEEELELEKNTYRKFKHLSISLEDFEKLKLTYTQNQIDMVLDSIENYTQNKKYSSLYLTALNWLKKEFGENKPTKKFSVVL